jgi:hypothetical protein
MKYSYKTETGGIRIINVLEGSPQALIPEGSELIGIVYEDLPPRYFRSIWEEKDGKISVDISKARSYKLEKIREIRNNHLNESDREFAEEMSKVYAHPGHGKKAIDEVAAILEIKAILDKKQRLRDLPESALAALNLLDDLNVIENHEVSFS